MWLRLIVVILLALTTSCASLDPSRRTLEQADEVEEYLIDFSKNIEGRKLLDQNLPPDLDADKFFAFLAADYPNKRLIGKVREYPVKVYPDGDSYILVLCDRDGKWIIFKDLGRTIDKVDFPYGREGKRVPCD
jgi:hypothetical protein